MIVSLAILAHSAGLKAPFTYDDQPTIIDNPHIKELERFQEKIGLENAINRSVTLLTYAVNMELGDLEVFGYHLLNFLLHVLTSICLYFTGRELLTLEPVNTRQQWNNLPLWAASIFTIHPMATQTISYLSNRSSLVAAFFSLLSFYVFLRFINSSGRENNLSRYWLIIPILALFYLALASKATSAILPLVSGAFLFFSSSKSPGKLILQLLVIISPLAFYLGYRSLELQDDGQLFGSPFKLPSEAGGGELSSLNYLLTQFGVVVFNYGVKLLWPIGLNFESDVKLTIGFSDPTWLCPGLILILASIALWYHPSKIARFGFIWAALTLLPSSSFIPLKQLASEHRTYLPSIGLSLTFAGFFLRAFQHWKNAGLFLFSFYLAALTIMSANRQLDYRSELVLWRDAVEKSPKKSLSLNNLANALIKEGRLDEAEIYLEKVISMDRTYMPPYINLGTIFYRRGKLEEAKIRFDMVISLGAQNGSAYYNAGIVRKELGQAKESLPYFQKASELNPDYGPYHLVLGNIFKKLGRLDEALTEYKLTLKYQPNNLGAINNRGTVFIKIGKLLLAESEFKKILAINPNHQEALNNLVAVYLSLHRYQEAIKLLDRILAVSPNNENMQKVRQAAQYHLNLENR